MEKKTYEGEFSYGHEGARYQVKPAVSTAMTTLRIPIQYDSFGANVSEIDHHESTRVVHNIWLYVAPIIFVVGVCGNSLTVAVCRRRRLRNTTVCVFLSLMAIADSTVLLSGVLPEWIENAGLHELRETSATACRWSKFLAYSTGDTAIWILVAFTVDRFAAVCFPLRKRELCMTHGAACACAVALLLSLVKNVHVFWTRGMEYGDLTGAIVSNCGRPRRYRDFEAYVRPWIAFTLVSAMPFTTILFCNIAIIRTLVVARWRRASCLAGGGSSGSDKLRHTAVLCISASANFLICISPSIVLLIGKPYWSRADDGERNVAYDVSKVVNNLLVYVNHSANFFLYCLTGRRFRHEFFAMIGCGDRGDYERTAWQQQHFPAQVTPRQQRHLANSSSSVCWTKAREEEENTGSSACLRGPSPCYHHYNEVSAA